METKIKRILEILCRNLENRQIPGAVIGAIALAQYGLPRYTVDIDLLVAGDHSSRVSAMMEKLGYICFQETEGFAQYDSEMGVFGRVDFMFVRTSEGLEIIDRRAIVEDELMGRIPVVQPGDYLILKLMAMANNPERAAGDEADMRIILRAFSAGLLSDQFEPLDMDRIKVFADRFNLTGKLQKMWVSEPDQH